MAPSAIENAAEGLLQQIEAQVKALPKEDAGGYAIPDVYLGTRRPIKVVIIGFGASAIELAYVLTRRDPKSQISLQCYEKNDEIGGTWYVIIWNLALSGNTLTAIGMRTRRHIAIHITISRN